MSGLDGCWQMGGYSFTALHSGAREADIASTVTRRVESRVRRGGMKSSWSGDFEMMKVGIWIMKEAGRCWRFWLHGFLIDKWAKLCPTSIGRTFLTFS